MCSSVSGFPPGAGSGWYGPPLRETTLDYMQASFRNSGSGVQPQVNATTTIGRVTQDIIGQRYLLSSN